MDTKVKKVLKPITFGDWLQVNEKYKTNKITIRKSIVSIRHTESKL